MCGLLVSGIGVTLIPVDRRLTCLRKSNWVMLIGTSWISFCDRCNARRFFSSLMSSGITRIELFCSHSIWRLVHKSIDLSICVNWLPSKMRDFKEGMDICIVTIRLSFILRFCNFDKDESCSGTSVNLFFLSSREVRLKRRLNFMGSWVSWFDLALRSSSLGQKPDSFWQGCEIVVTDIEIL